MTMTRVVRIVGIGVLAVTAASMLGVLIVRDQMSRHRRDLFSSRPLRRLAALGYVAGSPPAVESVRLLRDFIAWERQPLIRRRATQVLHRLEQQLEQAYVPGEVAG